MRILLVRHGETQYNADRRVQGQIDIPLNDTGRWQAERIGARLARYEPDLILTSDLSRAAETARAIAAHHPAAPLLDSELLREIHYGVFEGLDAGEIQSNYPEEMRLWQESDDGYMPPGAETITQQRARAELATQWLRERSNGGTIVVVSHGGIMRSLLGSLLSLEVEQQVRFHFDNTSLTALEETRRGLSLRLVNDTSHLGERAVFP